MRKTRSLAVGFIFSTALLASSVSLATGTTTYKISVTNLTPGQPIAPALAATHRPGMSFFQVGEAPLPELANLAEAGDGHPLAAKLLTTPGVTDAQVGTGGTGPGATSTLMVTANDRDYLSVGAMLGNTNDAFIAARNVALPKGKRAVYFANGYDAGTETNDESCATVPGTACHGVALSPEDSGEGFVYISNGIHGIGGLSAAEYDWQNPVARIVIERMY